jgi:hypothetical protein
MENTGLADPGKRRVISERNVKETQGVGTAVTYYEMWICNSSSSSLST